jgi:hypothetical protein
MCVIPSLWIISIDEASRKQRFLSLVEIHDIKIKDFVAASYNNTLGSYNGSKVSIENENKNVLRMVLDEDDTKNTAGIMENKHLTPLNDQIAMALSIAESANQSISTRIKSMISLAGANTTLTAMLSNNTLRKIDSLNIDCCDTDITYWFKEDQYQNLFFQLFLLILVSTRWLVTSTAKLSSTQRTFILILSMANALDTLDLFSCLSLEFVFKNSYLIFALLFMVSMSLLQFIVMPTVQPNNRSIYRNAGYEYDESASNSENCLGGNEIDGNMTRGHNYDDLRENENTNSSRLEKKRDKKQQFKTRNSRLSIKLFNRGYDLSNKKVSPNVQPIMFSYGLNNSYSHSQSYPFEKVIFSKLRFF